MLVRSEAAADIHAIRAVELAAFPTPLEADLVNRLRAEGDAVLSLVAEDAGAIVGHIMFSRMRAPFRALGLGPVAVIPARQRQGVGAKLIEDGLGRARNDGWQGVFVLGEPAYYGRFGFSVETAAGFQSPYAGPYFMAMALSDGRLPASVGRVDYAPVFCGARTVGPRQPKRA